MEEEQLYRIRTKKGAHVNKKRNKDGTRSAIQFDEKNGLKGPVDLIEVDEDEIRKQFRDEMATNQRSIGRIIAEEAVVPAIQEAFYEITYRALQAGGDWISNWLTKKINEPQKSVENKNISNKKDNRSNVVKKSPSTDIEIDSKPSGEKVKSVVHTKEEVEQIVNNMQFAAMYIAAGIRELSNTVIKDTELTAEETIEMQNKLDELSSENVMRTIDFMLEDKNRDILDSVTLQMFEAFRNKDFIIDGKTVPINKYFQIE